MLTSYLEGKKQYDAEQQEATSRDELTKLLSGYDPDAANAQAVAAQAMQYAPDVGLALMQDAITSRRKAAEQEQWTLIPTPEGESGQWYQNQNGETKKVGGGEGGSGPKPSDVNAMRGQVLGDKSFDAMSNVASIYPSMMQSAGQDDRTSDLDLIYGLAKMLDPTGVVRGEDAVMINSNAPGMDIVKSWLGTIEADPKARLQPAIRKDIMSLAYRRAKSTYDAYETFASQFRTIAEESGMKGSHVAPKFAEIVPFGQPQPDPDPDDKADDDANYPG